MKVFFLACGRRLSQMFDCVAQRLSSPKLLWTYRVVLSLPLLAAALFTVIYLAFFAYGLWHGHAMPSAELYFTLPGIGRLLAGKGHISNFCVGWAIIGFFLSLIACKGAPQVAPLETPLLRPMRVLALPVCVSIVLALQGAAVFFTDTPDVCYGHAIGGIVPFSDARGHYCYCMQYFVTGVMPDWVLRRPLAALFGTAMLGISGGDPLVTIMLRCFLTGVAICFFACAVARHYGLWSGIAAMGMAVFFVTPYLPTFLTEVLGFAWGCIAVAFWLEALHDRSLPLELTALGLTGFALLTRMGSMFLLPLLALYVVWKWKWHSPDGIYRSLPRLCVAVGFVMAMLVLANAGAMRLGKGTQTTGANYSYCFAGLSIGGNWHSAKKQYKNELSTLSTSAEKSNYLYQKAIANIWERPTIFWGRLWQGEQDFWKELPRFLSLSQLFLLPICALLAWHWRQCLVSERSFWLVFWLGVALSIPFIYFDSSWRVNIVAYPFMAVFVALALAVPQKSFATVATHSSLLAKGIILYAASLLLLMAITAVAPGVFPLSAAKMAAKYARLPLGKDERLMLGDGNVAGMIVVDDATPCTPGSVWQISRSSLKRFFKKNRNIRKKQDLFAAAALPKKPFAFMLCPVAGCFVSESPSLLLKKEVKLWKIAIAPLNVGKGYFNVITSAEPIETDNDILLPK